MIFTNAAPYLNKASIVLDKSGSPDFRNRLAKYLRQRINIGDKMVIKKIKQQRSSSNNLLQVADYVAGVVNRKFQNKKDWQDYYRFVASKEIWVQKWPRENRTPPLTL